VPAHVQDLAGYLSIRGWTVHVLSIAGPRTDDELAGGYTVHRPDRLARLESLARLLRAYPLFASRQALRFPGLATGNPRMFAGCLSLAAVCCELALQHDLRLISAYHLFAAGLAGAWATEILDARLVTTVFGEIYARPAYHRRRIREVRHIVQRSRVLLSCSHHCARSFELLGMAPAVRAVHYGVNPTEFTPEIDPSPVKARHKIEDRDQVVLYVGRLVREMGLHVLLGAVPRLLGNPRIKVIIAGANGDLRAEAEACATHYPGRVFVVPDVPQSELPRYYATATIAVSPSINERACLGLAVAEAMATARPVVVTNIGGGPELVEHNVNGLLIPPGDPVALANAVLDLAGDDARCRQLGQRSLDVAHRGFDRQMTNRQMEALFQEALA
jgi:glycosyltransferase involved in cell wall biosynthesis